MMLDAWAAYTNDAHLWFMCACDGCSGCKGGGHRMEVRNGSVILGGGALGMVCKTQKEYQQRVVSMHILKLHM
jgi:hypothetical protein